MRVVVKEISSSQTEFVGWKIHPGEIELELLSMEYYNSERCIIKVAFSMADFERLLEDGIEIQKEALDAGLPFTRIGS